MQCFTKILPLMLLGVVVFGCGGSGSAAEVECINDVCPCNEAGIRAAIAFGGGPYTFDCAEPTRVTLGTELVIENDVILDGEGNLTLDGNQQRRVFSVPRGVTAELIELNITKGSATEEHGGGIRNEGTLTLLESTVSECSAGRESGCRTDDASLLCSEGGAIWNAGSLTLMDTSIVDSTAHFGGGLANRDGVLVVVDSEIRGNSAAGCRGPGGIVCSGGGGIWNSAELMVMNSVVSQSAADWGAGIYTRRTFTMTDSAVFENTAGFDGGGILDFDSLEIVDSTVADNIAGQSGGGIANQAGLLELNGTTLSGNIAAAAGGAVFNPAAADAALVNSTVSGNEAETGGAVYNEGSLLLTSCTLAANNASAGTALFDVGTPGASPRLIRSTLIDGDCGGEPFGSDGFNIESPGDTCGLDQPSDQTSAGALGIEALDDNGGPTQTHALQQSSVAVDAIPEPDCVDLDGEPMIADQRGSARPAGASSACDVGAFELQP